MIPVVDFMAIWSARAESDCRLVTAIDAGTVVAQCAPVIIPGDFRVLRVAGPEAPSFWNAACVAELRAAAGEMVSMRLDIWRATRIEITPFGVADGARLRLNGQSYPLSTPPSGGYCPAEV